jgi:hypothetical protein
MTSRSANKSLVLHLIFTLAKSHTILSQVGQNFLIVIVFRIFMNYKIRKEITTSRNFLMIIQIQNYT